MGDTLPPDPYIALEVEKEATAAAIKAKYRKLVLKFHPDRVTVEDQKGPAADRFDQIQKAYEILSDEARRARYDAQCKLAELRKAVQDKGSYDAQENGRRPQHQTDSEATTVFEEVRQKREEALEPTNPSTKRYMSKQRRSPPLARRSPSATGSPSPTGSPPARMPFSTTVFYDLQLDGELNGHAVSSLPDTGASWNFLSSAYAREQKIQIDFAKTITVHMATGKPVRSLGLVKLMFRFKDSLEEHPLDFHVLPTCISQVVLGNTFLRATSAFTRFGHCIRRTLRQVLPHRLCFIGGSQYRMGGRLNGHSVAALPDTGSDLMLMSRSYAKQRGFPTEDNWDFYMTLQLGDSSTTRTTGYVDNVEWDFINGLDNKIGETELCGFWIVDDLTCDVILSDEFLLRTNALEEMRQCEFELESNQLALTAIKAVRMRSKKTVPPPDSHNEWSKKVQKERIYQSDVECDIGRLPEAEREQAKEELKRRWEDLQAQRPRPPTLASQTPAARYDTKWPSSTSNRALRQFSSRSPLSQRTSSPGTRSGKLDPG